VCAGSRWDATDSIWLSIHTKVCNAAGTPTVSATLTSPAYGTLVSASRWTGWVGTPTVDASIGAQNGGTGTAITITPVVTNFNNELLVLQTYTASYISAAPSGSSSLQSGGGARSYYTAKATAGTSATVNATTNASAAWNALLVGIYDAVSAAPTITTVNSGSAVKAGAVGVPLVGTGFSAGMSVSLDGIAQANVTVSSATAATFDVVTEPGSGTQAEFGSQNVEVTVSGTSSSPLAVSLIPPNGQLYVNVTSVNSTSTYDIQATPAFVAGDQIEASGSSNGTSAAPTGLQLNTDTTYQYTSGSTPVNFWARAWDSSTSTWGAWALQTVQQTVTITVPTGLIQALHQFFSLLPG
jgi:hypothetical protein